MTVTLDFVCRVLSIFDGFDRLSNDDVWWRTDDEYAPITLIVNCNDLFFWGCSDCETITPENVETLESAVRDVKALTGNNGGADAVFCCRVRGMRPQGACYSTKYYPVEIWPLFDAAGPEREIGIGNPKSAPSLTSPVETP